MSINRLSGAAVGSSTVVVVGTDSTPPAALTARAREVWEFLAGSPAGFAPAVSVAVSPRSLLCPPGWAGIVVLGDAALVTAPDHHAARLVERALRGLPAAALTDAYVLRSRLPVTGLLGPAALAHLDPAEFRPRPGAAVTAPLGLDHPGFRRFWQAADPCEVEESGIEEITTPAFAVIEHGEVVAAAGYRDGPRQDRPHHWIGAATPRPPVIRIPDSGRVRWLRPTVRSEKFLM
jgi:hypothetical protein